MPVPPDEDTPDDEPLDDDPPDEPLDDELFDDEDAPEDEVPTAVISGAERLAVEPFDDEEDTPPHAATKSDAMASALELTRGVFTRAILVHRRTPSRFKSVNDRPAKSILLTNAVCELPCSGLALEPPLLAFG